MSDTTDNKILVVGSSGQVGRELTARAAARGLCVAGLARPDIDITNDLSIRDAFQVCKPSLVINAAAYTAVDKAESEPELARAVNTLGPRLLAEACADFGIPLFHISTDYVFDGAKSEPYVENDPIAPLGTYGETKAAGEEAVRKALAAHLILRTAWVYSPFGSNFLKTMLRLATDHSELRIVDDQYGCPTAAQDVADALLEVAEQYFSTGMDRFADQWGTYHFCSGAATTWCGFARMIMLGAASRGAPSAGIVAIGSVDYPTPAKRPANSVLACDRIEEAFGIRPRSWVDALEETLDRLIPADTALEAETQ